MANNSSLLGALPPPLPRKSDSGIDSGAAKGGDGNAGSLASASYSASPSYRADHFGLILCVMFAFTAAVGVISFKVGQDIGYKAGAEYGVGLKSKELLRDKILAAGGKLPPEEGSEAAPKTDSGKGKTVQLPSSVRPQPQVIAASLQQPTATAVAAKPQYTIFVYSFGKGQQKAAADCAAELKKKAGVDAFIDPKDNSVYLGRWDSVRSPEGKKLKDKFTKYKWHQYSFDQCMFVDVPASMGRR